MSAHKGGTDRGEGFVGMIIGVSDLPVRHPHHDVVRSSPTKCPAEYWPIDPIAYVARGVIGRHRRAITEDPTVRCLSPVTGPMTVANDQRVRRATNQRAKALWIKVH